MSLINETFGYKSIWFVVKSGDEKVLSRVFNISEIQSCSFDEGVQLAVSDPNDVFISGPYDGWNFVFGIGLPDVTQPERIRGYLKKLATYVEEAYYFCSHRIVDAYGFAQLKERRIARTYFYLGEVGHIYENTGCKGEAEYLLGYHWADCDEKLFVEDNDIPDEESILSIAEAVSLSPISLVGREERYSFIGIKTK